MPSQETQQITQQAKLKHSISYYQKLMFDLCKAKYPALVEWAELFIERAKNKYDNHITVEGVTGSGKSVLTFILVHLKYHLLGREYDLKKQTLFIPDQSQLKNEIRALKPMDVYWLDEAIRALDKKQWYKLDQIELNHIVKTERWRQNTIFYNIQRFAELTETFRNDNIFFRIYVIPRYAAVLYIKDIDKDIDDPWHTNYNIRMKESSGKYKAFLEPEERLTRERKTINYYDDSYYPDITQHPELKEYWAYYEQLKVESRSKDTVEPEKLGRNNKIRPLLLTLMIEYFKSQKMSIKQVYDMCDMRRVAHYNTVIQMYQEFKNDPDLKNQDVTE